MDPITLLIAALVVSGMTVTLPRAVVDAFATAKAASAGQWDFLDRDRDRRATRVPMAERWAAAWSARRKARHEQAGGDGTYRPGAGAYAADLYHGFWERRLEVRKAKAAARPPYVHDPDRPPWHERADAAILGKVEDLRAAWGQRRPNPEPAAAADPPAPEPVEYPPGTVTYDDTGQQVPLGPPSIEEQPVIERKYDIPDPDFEQVAGPREDDNKARPDQNASTATTGGKTMTAPTMTGAAATEVNTNEDARRMFTDMAEAATDLAEAAAMAEEARAKLVTIAQGGADVMAVKRFDAGAQTAATQAADVVKLNTLGEWAEVAEAVSVSARNGLAALDKYRDAEAQVAENQIDPTTLAATSS